jgi:hypothetical protein
MKLMIVSYLCQFMQFIYVDMQLLYFEMQLINVNMQLIYVVIGHANYLSQYVTYVDVQLT